MRALSSRAHGLCKVSGGPCAARRQVPSKSQRSVVCGVRRYLPARHARSENELVWPRRFSWHDPRFCTGRARDLQSLSADVACPASMRSKLTPTMTSNAAAGAQALVSQPLLLMASLARDIQALRDQRAETMRLWLAVTREARLARATERRRRKPPTLQALTSGHKQMMMRMLWIADSDLELAALCLDPARYLPPWTALST